MKKLIGLFLFVITSIAGWAQPLLVGHRGSGYGVENTEEAFREGAKLGYAYVETDVKVTKDLKFVLTHDDNLSRFGSSLTITGSTLEQLQAVTLTQKRSGVTYTGTLMSLEELLDLCTELSIKPVIELKWATGVNSNDCSNIPLLIKTIEDKGFRDKCIILTSMKPCLEYIRTNYPDVTLQFLTGEYWENHFDWCVKWKIDVDIQAGYFDKLTVQKFHDVGLKVNMWTTNDEAGYKTYGNMRCDFITTDRLDGNNLPLLDVALELEPNTIDYPNLQVPTKGEYTPEPISEIEYPAYLNNLKVKRAIIKNDRWFVLAHDSANIPYLFSINTETGESTSINTDGISGGDITLNDIAFTADGMLLGCNLATVPHAGGGDVWKIYVWKDISLQPDVFVTVDKGSMLGNWRNALTGHTFAVSGRLDALQVYMTSSTGVTYRMCGLTIDDGVVTKNCYALNNTSYTDAKWGNFLIGVTPSSRDNIFIDSPTMYGQEYTFDWNSTQAPMIEYSYMNTSVAPELTNGVSFFRRAAKVYALIPSCNSDNSSVTAKIYDVVSNIETLNEVTPSLHDDFGVATGLIASGMEYNVTEQATYIYLFVEGRGLLKMLLDKVKSEDIVADIDLAIERQWIYSNTTDNVPSHIDGNNAQQGTAVNGYFYINDSAEKLIYVYGEDGLIGTMPGGAGYGCARDDAGNIIVRDDQDAGTTHSIIIYPAGSMPDNYTGVVNLSFDVALDGQANFINASGDVLHGEGYIYMFPNEQIHANVIKLENGVVISSTKSSDLSISGSAAGYIVPNGSDSENWYYQVRGNGIYHYNGGVNIQISPAKANTSQPTMNTTGGFAILNIRGIRVLVHNSGAHYRGGFTLRNLTTNKVITSIEPIGTLGYVEGGNRSTFNWLIPEQVNKGEYILYQYCPANGIACYKVYDKNFSGIENPCIEDINQVSINIEQGFVYITGGENLTIDIFDISGILVKSSRDSIVNISELAEGIYIAKCGDKTLKFAK